MARLSNIIKEQSKVKLIEADEEAPLELDDAPAEEAPAEDPGAGEAPVEGTDEIEAEEEPEEEETEEAPAEETEEETTEPENDLEEIDKVIEEMIGITEIQHTSSSTIIDFEDGGQSMYVHPMVSLKSETLNEIISLIIKDVKKTYSSSKDEITGKDLNKTKYWKSINTLIETMVRSQLTKSDNMDGLIDEIKQVFKVLEVK